MPGFGDLTPGNFAFFAQYVLAGFLIFLIRNAYVFGERPKIADVALDILLFSLVNQIVWRLLGSLGSWVAAVSARPGLVATMTPGADLAFYLEVLALPVVIGIMSGNALRRGWARGALRVISMPLVDPIPRAYDHVFATRGTGYVILSFQDGTKIYGYYGPQSRAGRDPGRSEIYLESLYVVADDGQWVETIPPRAALISLGGLTAMEFLNEKG